MQNNKLQLEGSVYSISSNYCQEEYFGKTTSLLNRKWYEHEKYILQCYTANPLVAHNNENENNFDIIKC